MWWKCFHTNQESIFLDDCRISGYFDTKFTAVFLVEQILCTFEDLKIANILNLEVYHLFEPRNVSFIAKEYQLCHFLSLYILLMKSITNQWVWELTFYCRCLIQPNQIRNSWYNCCCICFWWYLFVVHQAWNHMFDFMIEVGSKANICFRLDVVNKYGKPESSSLQ